MGIYQITCIPTGKIYIGSSVNLLHRWISHQSDLNLNKHGNSYLQRAWNKYGEDNFKCEVIQPVYNRENLLVIEEAWIRLKNCVDKNIGFNLTDNCTCPPMTGKKQSEETKAKVSIKNKGRKLSDKTRARMSSAHKGKIKSEESIKKTVETRRRNGSYTTEKVLAHMQKLREMIKGRQSSTKGKAGPKRDTSKETAIKISLASKGRYWGQGKKLEKAIVGYNDLGKEVIRFQSTSEAQRNGYSNITRAIKKNQRSNGLYFKYENDFSTYCLDTETGIYYANFSEVANAMDLKYSTFKGRLKSGFYKDRFQKV